jgi:transposase-like protein
MILKSSSRLPAQCFYKCSEPPHGLKLEAPLSPKSGLIVRKGSFFRKSDSKRISRFQCLICKRTFSQASYSDCFRQKKRRLNEPIRSALVAQGTYREISRMFGISRNTVKEKVLFLRKKAIRWQEEFLKEYSAKSPIRDIQFDEMETFERSKCLPLSLPLVVENKTRLVLGFRVSSMPAKGPLAETSRRKYGYRIDERPKAADALFTEIKPYLSPTLEISSDQNPKYPSWIRPHFPNARHRKFKGRRGCVTGQGELKAGGFDPLFSLNHTAAQLRAHVSRLFRRTWNTTKKKEHLAAHIAIYVQTHNQRILAKL